MCFKRQGLDLNDSKYLVRAIEERRVEGSLFFLYFLKSIDQFTIYLFFA